jgi:hypothetical protein
MPTTYTVEAAYYDTSNTRLKFVSFSSTATSGFSPTVVDSGGVGQYCRLTYFNPTLSTTNRIIAYYDATNQALKVAKRTPTGSWTLETVLDATEDVGKYCDITPGATLTSEVYISFVNNNTRVGRAYTSSVNMSGSSTWTTTYYNIGSTVDYTGIELNNDNGVISFRNNNYLKVLRTSDKFVSVGNYATVDTSSGTGWDAKIQYTDGAFFISYAYSYLSGSNLYRGIYFQKSTDNGVNWAKKTVSSWVGPGGGNSIPSLAVDTESGSTRMYMSYYDFGGLIGSPRNLVQAKSLDDGLTW